MLNRSQIRTLRKIRVRYSLFSQLPNEIIREIGLFGRDDPAFNKALHMTAYGDLDALKEMLDAASHSPDQTKLKELLFSTGTTVTPAGLTVKRKTLLEFAIEAGDSQMVNLLKTYFLEFTGGEEEMERQVAPYRPIIEAIETQPDDDLTWLFEIIKKSSLEDVRAELASGENYDPSYKSNLRTAMNQFRANKLDSKNRTITKPQMHCNYNNLLCTLYLLDDEWFNLKEGDSFEKHYLVLKQIIGFIQLTELPAIDRMVLARGQVKEAAAGGKLERLLNFLNGTFSFPDFNTERINSRSGLGYNCYVLRSSLVCPPNGDWRPSYDLIKDLKNLRFAKFKFLQESCSHIQNRNQPHV